MRAKNIALQSDSTPPQPPPVILRGLRMIHHKDICPMTTDTAGTVSHLIWIDLEMTGLDTQNDHIIEIATVITDKDLNVLAEGPVLAIHQPDPVMAAMDEWNTRQHGQSGLVARVRASQITMAEAERQTLAFLQQWVPERTSPMCGNSICQ